MDLSKSIEFFNPNKIEKKIHIIGCGSVGATLAENLVRCGVTNLVLWDFDYVEPKNINNQIYRFQDIGKSKVESLKNILLEINPDINNSVEIKTDGWKNENLSGYVFLAVDDIELRKEIVKTNLYNPYIKAVFDFRTSLESAQHYAADWKSKKQKDNFLKSMDFSKEEAEAATPISACGETLGVVTTVRLICSIGVNNFINFVKNNIVKNVIVIDGFNFGITAF